jgi:excisionase family DNA binding protein
MAPRQLASVAQVADHLGVSTKTIRRYIDAGLLRKYRVGPRLIRLDVDEVNALLRARLCDDSL